LDAVVIIMSIDEQISGLSKKFRFYK